MKYDLKQQFKVQGAQEYFAKLIEKKAFIELREVKLKRSLDQNGLYWLWLGVIETEMGLDRNECHLLYRAMYLPKEDHMIESIIRTDLWRRLKPRIEQFSYFKGLDQIIDVIAYSTTEQDSIQFTNYLNKIREHVRVNMNLILLTLEDKEFEAFYAEYGFR
jgi:hypothetical protein